MSLLARSLETTSVCLYRIPSTSDEARPWDSIRNSAAVAGRGKRWRIAPETIHHKRHSPHSTALTEAPSPFLGPFRWRIAPSTSPAFSWRWRVWRVVGGKWGQNKLLPPPPSPHPSASLHAPGTDRRTQNVAGGTVEAGSASTATGARRRAVAARSGGLAPSLRGACQGFAPAPQTRRGLHE